MLHEVVDKSLFLSVLLIFMTNPDVHPHDESLHEASLPGVPHPLGGVAEHRLEEENEANPLVVAVVLFGALVVVVVRNPRMSHFDTYGPPEGIGHGEGGSDPAEGIDRMSRKSRDNTLNGIADVLCRGDDERAGHEECRCEEVVESEDGIVCDYGLPLEVVLEASEESQHDVAM